MAKLTRDEFFNKLNDKFGTDSSDESIQFIEDMTDTYIDLEKQANGNGVDWEQKYKENDLAWKKKYRNKFFSGGDIAPPQDEENEEENKSANITINDLFK